MEALKEFTDVKRKELESAIELAENLTSGEIRVHIEDNCPENVLDRASFIFDRLEMENTEERNGVLFYLAYVDHKLAILGDVGINQKVPENFWEEIKDNLVISFKKNQFNQGLIDGIKKAGEQLAKYFPSKGIADRNELDNEITMGKDV